MFTASMIAKSTPKEIAEAVVSGEVDRHPGDVTTTSLGIGGMTVRVKGDQRSLIAAWRSTIAQLVEDVRDAVIREEVGEMVAAARKTIVRDGGMVIGKPIGKE